MILASKTEANLAGISRLQMSTELSDEELVSRAQEGDAWAKEVIYRRYARSLGGLAARLLGNKSEAEDLTQDTFVTAFQELDKLKDRAALRAWLTSICVNRAHKIFRRRKLRRKLGLVQCDTALPSLLERPVGDDVRVAMMDIGRFLDKVSASKRTCWWLRYGEGYSLQEVAETHGCSLATAKRRIASVHKQLGPLVNGVAEHLEAM